MEKKRISKEFSDYVQRCEAWKSIFLKPLDESVIAKIADLLARLDFVPDESGIPQGDWPQIIKVDPRVYLYFLKERVLVDEKGRRSNTTFEWKAEILEGGTLIWAGVIELHDDQLYDSYFLHATKGDIVAFLEFTDLDNFWSRQGFSKSKEEIHSLYTSGEPIITGEQIAKMMKNF